MARRLIAQTTSPLPYADAGPAELVAIWDAALTNLIDAAERAGADPWGDATPCPGWTVGDVVAHVTSIERFLMGRADPDHTPDYDVLPHAQSGLSRYTEVPVDLRRSRSRDDVLREARSTHADRRAELADLAESPDATVLGPFGKPMSLTAVLRMRILDIWIHEQDIRVATGHEDHWGTAAAWVTAGQIVTGLGRLWVRTVDAPEGEVLQLEVTGPGVSFRTQVGHLPDGRGAVIDAVPDPDVTVVLTWPDLVAASAGRVPGGATAEVAQVAGNDLLSGSLLTSLTITP